MDFKDVIEPNVFNTLTEMMNDRGYELENTTSEHNEPGCKFIIFKVKTDSDFEEEKKIDYSRTIIFFPDELKINIDIVKHKIAIMKSMQINKCIIVYKKNITSTAKKTISSFDNNFNIKNEGVDINIDIELFNIEELRYNITKHYLVPKHILVKDLEYVKSIKKKYGKSIPNMLRTDPISRYYKYKHGDLIKIIRDNGIIVYRIVI